ncbi:phosphonate C-P lyase system protein PhnG [Thioclava marina]|uniref:Phosphonate C-P lyase system protein PhnG n=1 Tax=Thioclava marina TaxID=1915077 RepID=A0ABX3MHP3_9RHOB|nr:phosphonate C-P lyase system protein PhnG [Thioclava marina]OOY10942.1 phosphonate C-P lyase system protein PhnG [Thioclava marina]
MSSLNQDQIARRDRMGLLARAEPSRLEKLFPEIPVHELLRAPEAGAVMVRGRVGASGGPFNLGEMTVTRCSLRLEGGAVGHAYVQGRDKSHALRAAALDALGEAGSEQVAPILNALCAEEAARRTERAEKAAATKVEFFTMVRGEDQ